MGLRGVRNWAISEVPRRPPCRPAPFPELSSTCDKLSRSPWSNLTVMATQDTEFNLELSRRKLLAAAGIGGAAVAAASLAGSRDAKAAPASARPSPDPAAPPVAGLHLQFGADASSEMVVSWHTLQPVR